MNIAIGADHRGFAYKKYIQEKITTITWVDVGAPNDTRSDYPLFARAAVQCMHDKKAEWAVLICGSGIGMAIMANRFRGIFAGVAWNEAVARMSREDDNTNVLVIPSDFVSANEAVSIVHAWLTATFKGNRYQTRIAMIDTLT